MELGNRKLSQQQSGLKVVSEEQLDNFETLSKDTQVTELQERPLIDLEDFKQVDMEAKLELIMIAMNKINTNFHHKFEKLRADLHDEKEGVFAKLRDLKQEADQQQIDIKNLQEVNAQMQDDLAILSGFVQVQDWQITSLREAVVDLKARSMAQNVIVTAIPGKENENPMDVAFEFITKVMELDIQKTDIWVAHRTGSNYAGRNRNLIIKCSYQLKDKIMSNKSNLKDKRNYRGEKYWLKIQKPEELKAKSSEMHTKIKTIKDRNSRSNPVDRVKVEDKQGILYVNNTKQVPKVRAPPPPPPHSC